MATIISRDEVIAEFEAAYEDEERTSNLKEQIKVIKTSIKERLDSFAATAEVNKKYVNEAYSKFKKYKQKRLKATDDDMYTLEAMVDEYFMNEEDQEEVRTDPAESDPETE